MNQQPPGARDGALRAAPDYAATLATMRQVLASRFGVEVDKLDENADLASLGLDSLGFVEYAFDLEVALHITLPDVPRDIVKVGDFACYVHGEVVKQYARPAE